MFVEIDAHVNAKGDIVAEGVEAGGYGRVAPTTCFRSLSKATQLLQSKRQSQSSVNA